MLRHVCFNASVFSLSVKIHAADIKSVLPKSNLFLPNSIEIIEVRQVPLSPASTVQSTRYAIITCLGSEQVIHAMQ